MNRVAREPSNPAKEPGKVRKFEPKSYSIDREFQNSLPSNDLIFLFKFQPK